MAVDRCCVCDGSGRINGVTPEGAFASSYCHRCSGDGIIDVPEPPNATMELKVDASSDRAFTIGGSLVYAAPFPPATMAYAAAFEPMTPSMPLVPRDLLAKLQYPPSTSAQGTVGEIRPTCGATERYDDISEDDLVLLVARRASRAELSHMAIELMRTALNIAETNGKSAAKEASNNKYDESFKKWKNDSTDDSHRG